MNRVAATSTETCALSDRSITASLTVERMTDLDTGQPTLVASTQGNQADLQVVSPARARDMVTQARAKLDEQLRLINEFEAHHTLAAILAEHDLTLIEVDMHTVTEFAGGLATRLRCWAGRDNGRLVVWVPRGQDPIERVNALADLVNAPHSVVREG